MKNELRWRKEGCIPGKKEVKMRLIYTDDG